jgi:Nucleotidyl transferase AbiEii toxin, Type IV TA system
MPDPYLHDRPDFSALIRIVADERKLLPALVEKDYWIMHCLHGLGARGFTFELKGGTSLSKGFGIIERFSEDIDIRIDPACASFQVFSGHNHMKAAHIASRKQFYDWLAEAIKIEGISSVVRDPAFDDEKYRNGGIRLRYDSAFETPPGLKEGVLLEVGFDDTMPNVPATISSWAFDKASTNDAITIRDNRAKNVLCYHPGYTFVEKLQTVSTKYRQQQAKGQMPADFLRHYYDISQLLDHPDVIAFIGTPEYHARKKKRFRKDDNLKIAENEAFLLSDVATREQYTLEYQKTASLYFNEQIPFEEFLGKIRGQIEKL